MKLLAIVLVLVVVGVVVWGVGVNNQLVASQQAINEQWAQVQNVYQRRADLIPNLVETVKGAAAQERTVLGKSRAKVGDLRGAAGTGSAERPEGPRAVPGGAEPALGGGEPACWWWSSATPT